MFSTLYGDLCALDPFCVFSLFHYLLHHLFFLCNSVICLFLRTIISIWNWCKISIFLFNSLSAAGEYLFAWTSFVLSSIWIFCNSLILVVSPWSNFLKLSFSFWIKLVYTGGKVLGNVIVNLYGITLGIDVGTELGYLVGSFIGYNDGNI